MDDWVFRRDLIEPAALKALSQRSDVRGAVQAASHFLAIGATGYGLFLTWGTLWCVPVFVLHGMLLNYLYAAQHELIHRTAFRTRRLNDWVGHLTGFLLIYPCDFDRIRHFQHHRHTKDVKLDSDIPNRMPMTLRLYVERMLAVKYWISRFSTLSRHVLGHADEFYFTDQDKRAIIREARWHLAGYGAVAAASLAFESGFAVWYWLLPLLLTKTTHQVHNLSEHSGLPNVPNVLQNTRTVATNPFMYWITWNMCYHADHHLFPGVPFHQLPRLHALVGAQLKAVAPSYHALHRSFIVSLWRERHAGAQAAT